MRTLMITGVLAALAAVGSGCSTFDDDYEMAVANQSTYTDITGPWVGTWQSEASDHKGPMRALVSQLGDGVYLARYEAEWGPGFEFETEVHLRQTGTDGAGVREFIGAEWFRFLRRKGEPGKGQRPRPFFYAATSVRAAFACRRHTRCPPTPRTCRPGSRTW